MNPALGIEGVDPLGIVEIGIWIGVPVRFVDPASDFEPVARPIVADSIFAGGGRRRGLRMVCFGGLVIEPLRGGLEGGDVRVGTVGTQV